MPGVAVEPVVESDVLRVVASSSESEDAARIANVYAAAYISFRWDDYQSKLRGADAWRPADNWRRLTKLS